MNIKEHKNKILSLTEVYLNDITSSYIKACDELASKELQVKQSISDYLLLKDSLVALKTESDNLLKDNKERINEINLKEEAVNIQFSKLENAKLEYNSIVEQISSIKDKLIQETKSLNFKSNELIKLTNLISEIDKELKSKSETVKQLDLDISNKNIEISKLTTEVFLELKKAKEDKEKTLAETSELRDFLNQKQIDLDLKEINLNKKDQGLKVVEERYKNLFGEKGLTFKV